MGKQNKGQEYYHRHLSGETWQGIADREGSTFDAVRNAARRWRQRNPHDKPEPPPLPPDLETLFDLAKRMQQAIDSVDPVITHAERRFEGDSPVGILFVSCAHLGSRYTFYDEFLALFRRVLATPNLFWLSLGDDVEGFLASFPDASAVTDQAIANPKVQRAMLARILDKLAERGKLLAGCASQHGGDWIRRRTGDDPIKDLYLERDVPYFDGKRLFTLTVGEQTYQIALAHEFPGFSMWNPSHAQRRAGTFDFPSADVVVMGDKHKGAVQRLTLPPFEFDAGLRPSFVQWLVQVGTMKQGLDKYSIRGWSRGVLEWPILVFHPHEHYIEWTDNLTRAQMMLEQSIAPFPR